MTHPPRVSVVEWNDAHADSLREITKTNPPDHVPWVMHTTGWIVQDDAVGLTIAHEMSRDSDGEITYRGYTFVPRGMVVSLKTANSRRKKAVEPPHESEPGV